jgi:hypothetical protein
MPEYQGKIPLNYQYIVFKKMKDRMVVTSRRRVGIRKGSMSVNMGDMFYIHI